MKRGRGFFRIRGIKNKNIRYLLIVLLLFLLYKNRVK